MKAIVCQKYGPPDVLELKQVAKPIPADNEVLVKVHATTVTSGDIRVRSFKSPILYWIPMRLLRSQKTKKTYTRGEFAGEIEAIGKDVKRFKKGDQVFALTGMVLVLMPSTHVCLKKGGGNKTGQYDL